MRFCLRAHSAAAHKPCWCAAYRECAGHSGICDRSLQEFILVAVSTGLLQAMNHEEVEASLAHCAKRRETYSSGWPDRLRNWHTYRCRAYVRSWEMLP